RPNSKRSRSPSHWFGVIRSGETEATRTPFERPSFDRARTTLRCQPWCFQPCITAHDLLKRLLSPNVTIPLPSSIRTLVSARGAKWHHPPAVYFCSVGIRRGSDSSACHPDCRSRCRSSPAELGRGIERD